MVTELKPQFAPHFCEMYQYALTFLMPVFSLLNREENTKIHSSGAGYELPQLKLNLKLKGPEPNGLKPWKPPWK